MFTVFFIFIIMNNIEAFIRYLEFEKKYSSHTVNAYMNDINCFQIFNKNQFGQDNIDRVNYSQIRNWIVLLVDDNLSNRSVNRKIQSLKAYYKFLLKLKLIEVNPLLKHKALKTSKIIQIPFSEKELVAVMDQTQGLTKFEEIRNNLIIDLLYTTGIRRSELVHLKMVNVDTSSSLIKVLGKRNKERILPVLPIIVQKIHGYLMERAGLENIVDLDFFFLTKKGIKLNDSLVYRLINSYFSNVSVKVKKSPHILRHTFATHLLNNGADLNSVKELLGHSSLASTQVYTHSSLTELKKVYKDAHPRNNDNSKNV